jgi:hypothetical protein
LCDPDKTAAVEWREIERRTVVGEHRPNVPPWVTADLAADVFDLADEEQPSWGDPLRDVIEERAPWRDWLEAAVLAGYIPHLEGLALALRGVHAWWLEEIGESEAQGAHADALACTRAADGYRSLISMLEEFVADMESRAAEMNRRHGLVEVGQAAVRWQEDAEAAEQRATHALERRRLAEDDNPRGLGGERA